MISSTQKKNNIPHELYKDFLRLGLKPGASLDVCKNAQRNLLKKHHPDHHSDTTFNFNVATEITTSINVAYQRIAMWYQKGILEDIS